MCIYAELQSRIVSNKYDTESKKILTKLIELERDKYKLEQKDKEKNILIAKLSIQTIAV